MAAACLVDTQQHSSSSSHEREWFAVHVVARRELAVAASLREKGYDEFVPTQVERGRRSHAQRVVRPVFPGYVFCRMDASIAQAKICTTPGFIRIVSFGQRPLPIAAAEVESIRLALAAGCYLQPTAFYQAGDLVSVVNGPLAGVEGRLVRQTMPETLVLSVTLLQRAVSVQIDADAVQLIARGDAR
jgi:transcriptional antiterminator RfaH